MEIRSNRGSSWTSMEIESEDGATIPIERHSSTEIGRRPGRGLRRPSPPDRTVSRRHLSLRLAGGGDSEDGPRVLFEVIGRNPVVVCGCGGRRRPRVYRSSEKGELRDGDRLSLSLKNLSFWVLRRRGAAPEAVEQKVVDAVARREKRTSERKKKERKTAIEAIGAEEEDLEQELAALDASQIDPIKEFGFLVKGHEFDRFPRHMIRSLKDWNWFLDGDDDDDEHEGIKRNMRGKKRKNEGDDCEDEEWADVVEVRNASRPMYSTRSNRPKKPKKEEEEEEEVEEVEEEEDDDDETLGGFIVDDGGGVDEEDEGELEEEEEFDGEDEEEDE